MEIAKVHYPCVHMCMCPSECVHTCTYTWCSHTQREADNGPHISSTYCLTSIVPRVGQPNRWQLARDSWYHSAILNVSANQKGPIKNYTREEFRHHHPGVPNYRWDWDEFGSCSKISETHMPRCKDSPQSSCLLHSQCPDLLILHS